jgi:alpha-glucosidase
LKQGGKRNLQMIVTARENYIARCDGKARTFPWRVICIARDDRSLAQNDLITRLAPPAEGDFSWVKPGKVAWEWWNQFAIGDVDFTPGVNTETYKAYIDFAARHGIEYILLDEGWAVRYADDLFSVVPEIDLEEIIGYSKQKNVGIILWAGYSAFVKDIEQVCKHYAAMGVKGLKIDFFDRNDQIVQEVMYETARIAAKYRMLLDFHGCPPPTGLQKQFPNVLNYEGIFGLEQMRNRALPQYDMVSFDVTAPFIRFVTGPADYTPGAFLNGTRETFVPYKPAPMSQGTRCRQLAEYVVFDAPMQMLCDGPAHYEADPACADFIYRVPTVWDETRVLDGRIGDYIVTARRKGDTWYIGAMTDWNARDLVVDLWALGLPEASVEAWEDGPDADSKATDWQKRTVSASGEIKIHLAPGGGWAAIVKSVK